MEAELSEPGDDPLATDNMFNSGPHSLCMFPNGFARKKWWKFVEPSLLLEVSTDNKSRACGIESLKVEDCLVSVLTIGVPILS